ncbi:MAG: hypothetical protein D6776_00965 [Planctomycetota bacterium]|nr:MAG: hypothetical protein D6776_00965 [Planctomycetota bacterium]
MICARNHATTSTMIATAATTTHRMPHPIRTVMISASPISSTKVHGLPSGSATTRTRSWRCI